MAWEKGGLSPFNMLPYYTMLRAGMISRRAEARAEARRKGIVPSDSGVARMSAGDALRWGQMAALMPLPDERASICRSS